eukprot:6489659-Amphidinium_carterae.4
MKKRSADADMHETPDKKAKASDVAAPVEPIGLNRAWSAKSLVGSSPDSAQKQLLEALGDEAASTEVPAAVDPLEAEEGAAALAAVAKSEMEEPNMYDESGLMDPPVPEEQACLGKCRRALLIMLDVTEASGSVKRVAGMHWLQRSHCPKTSVVCLVRGIAFPCNVEIIIATHFHALCLTCFHAPSGPALFLFESDFSSELLCGPLSQVVMFMIGFASWFVASVRLCGCSAKCIIKRSCVLAAQQLKGTCNVGLAIEHGNSSACLLAPCERAR